MRRLIISKKINNGNDLPSFTDLDKFIHEPARLIIMSILYVVKSADFIFLVGQTGMTWGNLSAHISKLETAGYVEIKKEFIGKKPHTTIHLTEQGRIAFDTYQKNMKKVLDETLNKVKRSHS